MNIFTFSLFQGNSKNIINRLLWFFLLLIVSSSVFAATKYSTGNNNLNTTTWAPNSDGSGTLSAAIAGDVLIIRNGHTITVTSTFTQNTTSITIQSGGVLTGSSSLTLLSLTVEIGGSNNTTGAATFANGLIANGSYINTKAIVITTGGLTIGSSGTVTHGDALTITGNTVVEGILNLNPTSTGRAIAFNGDVTLNSTSTWGNPGAGGAAGKNPTISITGNFTNNASAFSSVSTGIVTFSGASKTISGSTVSSFPNVTISGTREISAGVTLTVGTALTGSTLTNKGILNIGGTSTSTTLVASPTTNMVNYTGAAQTVLPISYVNLGLIGTLAKSITSGTAISGTFTIGGATASALIANGVNITVEDLKFGTTSQVSGTYGSTFASNTATNKNATYFGSTTTGMITVPASGIAPPTLTADAFANTVDNNIEITSGGDNAWGAAITGVKIGGTALTAGDWDKTTIPGTLILKPSNGNTLLTTAGSKAVTVQATGYSSDASVTQVINAGVPIAANSTVSITPALAPNTTSTITITAKDQYNNLVSGYTFKYDATITNNSNTTAESFTLDGTTVTTTANDVNVVTATNASGVATFTAQLPITIDGNDGIAIQVQLNDGATNIGSAFSFLQLDSQTITFGALTSVTYGVVAYDLTGSAIASSGLTVAYASSNSAVATILGTNITIVGAGSTNITASQSGNVSYNAATPVVQALTVNKVALTITAGNQSVGYGSAASVVTAAGTCTPTGFVGGETASVITGAPAYSTSYTNATAVGVSGVTITPALGTLTATNYSFSTFVNGTVTVTLGTQMIIMTSTATKSLGFSDYSPATSATSGINPITYTSSNTSVAVAVNGGTQIRYIGQGQTIITASQAGNTNYSAATDVTQTLTVTPKKVLYVSKGTAAVDATVRMLTTENFQVTTFNSDGSATGLPPLSGFDLLVVQESFSSTDAALKPGGNLGLGNITIPVIYNKTFAFKNTGNLSSSNTSTSGGKEATSLLAATIVSGKESNLIFSGISTSSIPLLKTLVSSKAINYADPLTISTSGTLLATVANITNTDASIFINDIPANTQLGSVATDKCPSRMITFGFNNTTLLDGDGKNLTNEYLTIWRNAAYILTNQTPPTTLYMNTDNDQTITFGSLSSKVVGDGVFALTATSAQSPNSGNPITYTSSNTNVATISGSTVTIVGAGTATITASQAGGGTGAYWYPATDVTQVLNVAPANNWIGGTSNWNTNSNWSLGNVPSSTDNITISSGNPNMDIDFTLASGRSLTISGTGVLTINAGKSLSIGSGATVDFGGKSVTLKSDATGTASIGQIGGTLSNASNVTVERYIPAKRAWRFMGAPLKSSSNNSIFYNWQNNGSSVTNYGVELWSPTGTTAPSVLNGGMALGGATSIKAYSNNAWSSLTSTVSNNLFDGTTNNAYSVFVTGPFTTNSSGNIYSGSAATTLRATGTLIQGTHVKTLTPTAANQYFLVANPYASAVSPASITLSSNIATNFYMWDPNCLGDYNVGQYNTYNKTGASYSLVTNSVSGTVYTNSTAIQSGQAFFVQVTDNQPATITFNETDKVSGSTNVFRTSSTDVQIMRHTLKKTINGELMNIDGALGIFYNGGNATVDYNDAAKFSNSTENLILRRTNGSYAIEERPLVTDKDTLFVRLTNTNQSAYTLELTGENLTTTPGLTAELKDKYTNTSIPLSLVDTNNYSFAVDANATSTGDRFMVVFKSNTTLPLQFTNLNAYQKVAAVQVDWKEATEQNMKQYVVEKSTNAVNFTSIATQTANNVANSSYSAIDNTPNTGNNYYRVLSIANDGSKVYSNVALVKIGGKQSSISVYPNPIVGNTMNLQLQNVAKGEYAVQMINESGRVVYQTNVQHAGGSGAQSIKLPSAMSSGNYVMKAIDEKGVVFTQKVLVDGK